MSLKFVDGQIKLPHWLKDPIYSDRKRRTILRRYLILRTLTLNEGLTIYALRHKIIDDTGEDITLPRLRSYLKTLKRRSWISLGKAKTKRMEKIYSVKLEAVGMLYYQHFLSKGDTLTIIETRSRWAALFKEMGFSKDMLILLEEKFSAYVLSQHFLFSRYRFSDLTSARVRNIIQRTIQTSFRDIEFWIFEGILSKIIFDRNLSEQFKKRVVADPELCSLLHDLKYEYGLMKDFYSESVKSYRSILEFFDEITPIVVRETLSKNKRIEAARRLRGKRRH